MKKYLLTICLAAICYSSFAQSPEFIIKGGINFGKFLYPGNMIDYGISGSTVSGYQVGVATDIDLSKSVSIQPALLFVRTGTKYSGIGYTGMRNDGSVKINYLQVPVNLLYHVPVKAHDIYFGGGPFIGYAISGTFNNTFTWQMPESGTPVREETKGSLSFTDDSYNNYNRLNAGLGLMAGITLKNGLLLNVDYNLGLTNISKSSPKTKTSIFGISVGYAF